MTRNGLSNPQNRQPDKDGTVDKTNKSVELYDCLSVVGIYACFREKGSDCKRELPNNLIGDSAPQGFLLCFLDILLTS